MKKAVVFGLFWILVGSVKGWAQSEGSDYKTALGLKYYPGALTFKQFIGENRALEGLLQFWNYGTRFTAFYEVHKQLPDIPGMKVYLGGGGHAGGWNGNWEHDHPTRAQGLMIGIDGVAGIDYKFNGAPIVLSVDVQPGLNIVGYTYAYLWGGLALRYAF